MLTGRRIVVTGAARGFGRALAWQLAAAGAYPVLLARDADALSATSAAIRASDASEPETYAVALEDLAAVEAVAAEVLTRGAIVDGIVHNAAPWLAGSLSDLDAPAAVDALTVGVAAPLTLTRALLFGLRRARSPRIVVVVSRLALPGHAEHPTASPAFVAVKHAQAGLAEALRDELRADRIAVTALFPPDFDDIQPDTPAWDAPGGERPNNRDIADAAMFALAAPDRAPLDAIITAQGAPHPDPTP